MFRSADRGAIWARRLEIMRGCGEEQKALAEARAMLESEKVNEGVNPYRFHALKFIAESMAAADARGEAGGEGEQYRHDQRRERHRLIPPEAGKQLCSE